MPKYILIVLYFLGLVIAQGQTPEEYAPLINEAWDLYEKKEFLKSGQSYNKAFATWDDRGMIDDRYNAACSWALAGNPDSSFHHLTRIAEKGNYANLHHLVNDSDLFSLHEDSRWSIVVDKVRANKEKVEEHLDKDLVVMLDTIFDDDQVLRREIQAINEKYGWESEEMKAHWKKIQKQDSINLIKVEKILEEKGWLGADIIGGKGNQTLFLVIQHAALEKQEKYLPMMREAVKKGNANAASLALLEDRVALGKGDKQIYGSQIGRNEETGEHYVLPLVDPVNVDMRRAEVGLPPLAEYVSRWNIVWDAEKYVQDMEKSEKE